jgi:hypothetical protein
MNKESICVGCIHSYVCEKFNTDRDVYRDKCAYNNDHFLPDDTITKLQKELDTLQTLRDLDKAFYKEKCAEYDLLLYKYDKLKTLKD